MVKYWGHLAVPPTENVSPEHDIMNWLADECFFGREHNSFSFFLLSGWWYVEIETFGHQIKQINYRRVWKRKKRNSNDALWTVCTVITFHRWTVFTNWQMKMQNDNQHMREKATQARNTTEWVRVLRYLYLIINNFILILFYYYCHNYAFRFFLYDVASWLAYRRTLFSSILLFCLPCHWNLGIIFGSKWCSRLFSSIFVVFI